MKAKNFIVQWSNWPSGWNFTRFKNLREAKKFAKECYFTNDVKIIIY